MGFELDPLGILIACLTEKFFTRSLFLAAVEANIGIHELQLFTYQENRLEYTGRNENERREPSEKNSRKLA